MNNGNPNMRELLTFALVFSGKFHPLDTTDPKSRELAATKTVQYVDAILKELEKPRE